MRTSLAFALVAIVVATRSIERSTHEYILLFNHTGRCYWLKVFEIPEAGSAARGKSIANLISKPPAETILAYVAVKNLEDPPHVLIMTEAGIVKKTPPQEYGNPRKSGIAAITLGKGDKLIDVRLTNGKREIVIGTREGVAIRFLKQEARPMGRTAGGVRGIRLE